MKDNVNIISTPFFEITLNASLYDGIMIVGTAFGGKTSIYKALAKALGRQNKYKGEKFVSTVVVNPKSVTIQQLFGYFDECHEWKDGILATSLRAFSNQNPEGKTIYILKDKL